MSRKLSIVILVPELREVAPDDDLATLSTAHEVAKHYDQLGHETKIVYFDYDIDKFNAAITAEKPDCVFNLVESVYGRSRLIHLPGIYLEDLGLPYTGCDANSIYLTNDKVLAKQFLALLKIPTPELIVNGAANKRRGKVIVKARHEHASFGISQANVVDAHEAPELVKQLTKEHACEWMTESYVEGREFNTSVIATPEGPRVLPVSEIKFENYGNELHRIIDYKAKWDNNSFESTHTVRCYDHSKIDQPLVDELRALSLKIWNGFGLDGWARVDFRVDSERRPYVVDINANPDLSLDAGFMAAAEHAGIAPHEAIQIITDAALRPH